MPNASAANAPCVLVCESPQTTVMPGSVAPLSGPMTCTMPWRRSRNGKYAFAPKLRMFVVERLDLRARDRIADALVPVRRRRVVIGGGDDRLDAPRLAAGHPQAFVRLRARHLVDEMPIDVEQRRAVVLLADDVAVPQLVVERARVHERTLPKASKWTPF